MLPIVILAGGFATRLGSQTQNLPKSLIPINGIPFIKLQLDDLRSKGVGKVHLCLGHLGAMVRDFVGDGSNFGLEISYTFDGVSPRGTAGAMFQAMEILNQDFGVIYGDSFLPIDIDPIERYFLSNSATALMVVMKNQNRWETSNVDFAFGQVRKYEKGNSSSSFEHVDYGLSYFTRGALSEFRDLSLPLDLSFVMNRLAKLGKLSGYEVSQRFYEVGSYSGQDELITFLGGENGVHRATLE